MSTDEELTLSVIHRDLKMMQQLCEHYEGHVLKSTGDGCLMYFVSAIQAVQCSIAIQQRLAEQASQVNANETLAHRIGIHLGDVFLSESDVMGNGVNIAARLETEAEPGGICISQTVYDVVKSRLSLNAVYLGPLRLKNIQEAVSAYHIAPASPSQAYQASPSGSQVGVQSGSENARSLNSQVDVQTNTSSRSNNIEPGHIVHNRYCIQRILGQGGFGRTYLATDTHRFDDRCVLKEFLPLNKSNYVVEKSRSLFEREAKTLYQIDHPQIPKFLAWFTHDHRLFIVQEYIDGQTYAHLLRDRYMHNQCFSESEIVQWLSDLLGVLSYLHSKGIVHRDISPDNIMLPTGRSKPVLIDFGLVKQTVSEMWKMSPSGQYNSQNSFVGKLGYAPPEQIRMGKCFPASDLYALGVTAIVLLTGREPNLLMDQGSLEWDWRSHVQVSDALANILDTMLAEKPNNRYASAQDARNVLQNLNNLEGRGQRLSVSSSHVTPQTGSINQESTRPSISSVSSSAPLPATPSPSSITITPAILELYKEELMKVIGPIASYVVAETYAKHPEASPAHLMNLLTREIPNTQQIGAFKQSLKQAILKHTSTSRAQPLEQSQPATTPKSMPQDSSKRFPNSVSSVSSRHKPQTSSVSPAFIEHCRSELARCIGPMATFVMDDVLAHGSYTSPQQLVRAIAAEIPDAKKAKTFEQTLL